MSVILRSKPVHDYLGVGDAARELSEIYGIVVKPRDLSVRLYDWRLDASRCPIVGGRRVIPRSYLPEIARHITGK